MRIQPFATQLRRLLLEYGHKRSIFDIPASLFFTARPHAPFAAPDVFRRPKVTGSSSSSRVNRATRSVSSANASGRILMATT